MCKGHFRLLEYKGPFSRKRSHILIVTSWCTCWGYSVHPVIRKGGFHFQALETFKQEQLVETQSEKSDHLPALSDRSHVTPDDHPKYEILVTRKFELTELCQVFVGRWFKVFYLLVVITASFIVLWTYSTVAGSAWSTNLPLNFGPLRMCTEEEFQDNIYPKGSGCLAAYRFCVFLFAVVVLPLSLLDLKNVGVIQTIFGGLRFAIIGAMVLYALFNLGIGGLQGGVPLSANGTESNLTGNVLSDFVYGFSFTGWLSAIALFTSALIIHPGLSTLTHPIKNKKPLGWFVLSIYGTVAVFYVLMGVILTLWFGSDVNSTITLNWVRTNKNASITNACMHASIQPCPNHTLLDIKCVGN